MEDDVAVVEVPTDKIIETYVKIRDKRAELKREFEEKDSELADKLYTR